MTDTINAYARVAVLFVILIGVLVLGGCQGLLSSRSSEVNVHTGTEGVVPVFVPNAPPSRMAENTKVPVMLQLENRGVKDVQNGIVMFGGDAGYVVFEDQQASFALEGRSKVNPFPGKTLMETTMQAGELDPQRQVHEATVTATVCYSYETRAGINVCIDTDPLNLAQRKKVCSPGAVSGSGGQGGPVAVVEVTPSMIPESEGVVPSFAIRIENRGQGLVLDPRKTSLACQPLVQSREVFDIVELSARLTDTVLICDEKVRLEDGKAEVECSSPESLSKALGSYMAPLSVTIRYGYTQSVAVPVKIERRAR